MKFLIALFLVVGTAQADNWDNKPLYDVLTSNSVQTVKFKFKPFETRGGLNTHFQDGSAVPTTRADDAGCLIQVMGRERDSFTARPGDRYNGPIYKIDVEGTYTAKEPKQYKDSPAPGARYPDKSGLSFYVSQEDGKVKQLYVGCSRQDRALTLGDFKKAMGNYATVEITGKDAASASGDSNKSQGSTSDAE